MTTYTTIQRKLNKEISTLIKQSHYATSASSSLRKQITYADFLADKMLIVRVIRAGIPYSFFSLIQHQTPFNENEWAVFLNMNVKSLQRYKQANTSFKPIHSEKIIEMAEVTNVGVDVFGDIDKFRLWLDTPNFALGNLKPLELLNDSYGKEMVISELVSINHGILV